MNLDAQIGRMSPDTIMCNSKLNSMKRFISTKFFLTLQDASPKSINIDAQVLDNEYDEFVILLFMGTALSSDRAAYRNSLIYTHAELVGLAGVSGKKQGNRSLQSP
jgi:hypothetical protein